MLGDLDELVLQCRNERARTHIGEAVAAYKAGAYRSAIIMTWVALAFDIVDKFRELSLGGDAAAGKKMEEYDKIHKAADVRASLAFEREMLAAAKKDFELISETEFVELERIQEDRNRCAHPSLNVDGEAFAPSAELARTHIRAAIEYVLRNEPAQGKHALDFVMRLVQSEFFPRATKEVIDSLRHTPLKTGRTSLVRGFMVIMLKSLLRDNPDAAMRAKYLNCLDFIREERPDIWTTLFDVELAQLARSLEVQHHGIALLSLVCRFPDAWEALPPVLRAGLDLLMRDLPEEDIGLLEGLAGFVPLKAATTVRIGRLDPDDISIFYFGEIPRPVWAHVLRSISKAKSPALAHAWANVLSNCLLIGEVKMSQEDADMLCDAIVENQHVREPKVVDTILGAIRRHVGDGGDAWNHMVAQTGLGGPRVVDA